MAATLNGEPADREQPLAFPEPPEHRPARERASILLVDDDEKSLRTLRHVLEPLGQNLVEARSGEEALRWLLHEEFAVILLDMRMPGLDGIQTARYINARARTRQTPIVFLTAHAGDVERIFGAHAAGAVDYVSKPFEPGVLRSKVGVFVELHSARSEHLREARARAEAEGAVNALGRLQSISDAALAHLELSELIPELLRRTAEAFDVEVAGLLLDGAEERSLTFFSRSGFEHVGDEGALARVRALVSGAIAGGGSCAIGPEAKGDLPGALASDAPVSMVAALLDSSDESFGALLLASNRAQGFSDGDSLVLKLGAERAGAALEHARSYDRERGLVEALQEHLLPDRLPHTPGLAMAARYRPSEHFARVGGDWYDAISLPDGGLGLVIGDVVGHGVAAATRMAELRAALRAYAAATPGSPGSTVQALNRLVASAHEGMVATMLYMVIDDQSGRLRFASAGHLPPLVVDAGGEATYLSHRPAPPLGVSDHAVFEEFEAELPAGGTLLLYTDGLVERRGASLDNGLTRVAKCLRSAPQDLDDLCAHVLSCAFEGAELRDDTALLAVRRLAQSSMLLDLRLPAEPESVPAARHRLGAWLGASPASSDEAFDVLLAATEASTNAVEHAYGPGSGAMFHLVAERTERGVRLRVSDSGSWREPRGLMRGRGLKLIKSVMDDVEIQHGTTGTTVSMSRQLTGDGRS